MANEATVRISLNLVKGSLSYRPPATSYKLDVTALGGPAPGMVNVPLQGADLDFSALALPGLMRLQNLDPANMVTVGTKDTTTGLFVPLFDVQPGKFYLWYLSRYFGKNITGTGTHAGTDACKLHVKPWNAACKILVEAFEA